ncbi:MAG: hypothetical protein NTX00_00115 [Candidatus Parcubacteria bacterium]|nr:hypothetical protein [Candidatus Parcubacteria bacterium]
MATKKFLKSRLDPKNIRQEIILAGLYEDKNGILLKKSPNGYLYLPARKMVKIIDPDKGFDQLDEEYEIIISVFLQQTGLELEIYTPIGIYEFGKSKKLIKVFALIIEKKQKLEMEKYNLVFFPADPKKVEKSPKIYHADRAIILDYLANHAKIWQEQPSFNCLIVKAVSF